MNNVYYNSWDSLIIIIAFQLLKKYGLLSKNDSSPCPLENIVENMKLGNVINCWNILFIYSYSQGLSSQVLLFSIIWSFRVITIVLYT